MGNCIGSAFALSHDSKNVSHNEEDQELKASAKIRVGPCNGWEKAVPELCKSLKVADNGQRVKIVVTKKQLQMLKKSVEELKLRHIVIQSIGRRSKKWRPSLATIPEL